MGLSPIARSQVEQATVIVGGERHLAMLPSDGAQERRVWTSPIADSIQTIVQRRGQAVCVLASGDPLCYGVGATLLRQIAIAEMTIIPAPSAFSLACARLGWATTEVETLSLCGRDPALIQAVLYPGARVLVLSAGRETPAHIADLLTQRGYGSSQMVVLERLGGDRERRVEGIANCWTGQDLADLNTIALTCVADPGVVPLARSPGLPDWAYHHDGQLTKREMRAVTLATLAPLPGQLLWDVGAGCGSIGIEWMRSHPRCQAIAIERVSARLQMIADNAATLGTPNLQIVAGEAPAALQELPPPDAIFIGGGFTGDRVFETSWSALRSGGRLVVNAVTVETEQQVFQWHRQLGGDLLRVAIQRAEPVGGFWGWKAMAPVTQWVVVKP